MIDINKTTIGDTGLFFRGDGIDNVSSLPRQEFSEEEIRDRILKYTLVTSYNGKYQILKHKVLDLVRTEMLEDELERPIYEERYPFGNLLMKNKEKQDFIMELNKKDSGFCSLLKVYANNYINDIKAMVKEYEDFIKKNPEDEDDIALKNQYAAIRDKYNETLKMDKKYLIKRLKSSIVSWGHKFSIQFLEYLYSDGILIGRHPLCQIPIKEEEDSRVSALQGILSLDNSKVRYDNLGCNLTTIIRHKQIGRNLEDYLVDDNSVIDLNSRDYQLTMLFFGKKVPLCGEGDDTRLMDDLKQSSFKQPQYYLALELSAK